MDCSLSYFRKLFARTYDEQQDSLYNEQLDKLSIQLDIIIELLESKNKTDTYTPVLTPPILSPPTLTPPIEETIIRPPSEESFEIIKPHIDEHQEIIEKPQEPPPAPPLPPQSAFKKNVSTPQNDVLSAITAEISRRNSSTYYS
tara:strand:+ start:770 stop:1201 length:432 start_codon:yes stop_codon:yes gene_type:complete